MKPYSPPHDGDFQPSLPCAPLAQDGKLMCLEDSATGVSLGKRTGASAECRGQGFYAAPAACLEFISFVPLKILVTFKNYLLIGR